MKTEPTITSNIRVLLQERGYTVRAMAQALQVPERTIYYAFERHGYKKQLLDKIALFLGVETQELRRKKSANIVQESEQETAYKPVRKPTAQNLIDYLQQENERKQKIIEEKDRIIIELLRAKADTKIDTNS